MSEIIESNQSGEAIDLNEAIKRRLDHLGLLESVRIMVLLHQPLISSSIYQSFYHLLAPFLPNSWKPVMEPDNFIKLTEMLVED